MGADVLLSLSVAATYDVYTYAYNDRYTHL